MNLIMIFKIVIFILVTKLKGKVYGETTEIKCTQEYCMNFINDKGCPQLNTNCLAMNSTHYGIFFEYPDVCNCCDYCLLNLVSENDCMQGYPGLQSESISVCGHGLSCTLNSTNDTSTCQRIKTNCTRAQDDWDERRANGNIGMTEVRPKCDDNGAFATFHCIPGSICYCISPEGKRIFGETPFLNPWNEPIMTCGCGLNEWKMKNTLDIERWKNKGSTEVLGARCMGNGQYDPLQCMSGENGKCFCVDPVTGRPNGNIQEVMNVSDIRENHPPCFDPLRHVAGTYDTVCESMRMSPYESGYSFIDPICQSDGMFNRWQILGSRKICVDPLGKQIIHDGVEYGANLNSSIAKIMNCNCARNIWLLSSAGVFELPKCCENGNFELWQCRRKVCYCVDYNGDQIGLEIHIQNVSMLSCYNTGQSCLK